MEDPADNTSVEEEREGREGEREEEVEKQCRTFSLWFKIS